MSAHYVYRCYDDTGRLVYVGESCDAVRRLEFHRYNSVWARHVARVRVAVHPDREAARTAEQHAIRTENPRFNRMGRWRSRPTWTEQDYIDYVEALLAAGTWYTDTNARVLDRLIDEFRVRFGHAHPLLDVITAKRLERKRWVA